MPYYVDNERKYAIWFNRYDDWMIGYYSNAKEGKDGFIRNNEYVACPTDTTDWREYYNGEWKINLNARLTEYSKWPKYSGSFLRYF